MKFSKYISKAVTPVMALFQKQHGCLSNKATTICGYSVCSLRQVPVRHNRGGKSTENKVRFAPPTMCRLTSNLYNNFVCYIFSVCIAYFLQIVFNLPFWMLFLNLFLIIFFLCMVKEVMVCFCKRNMF